MKMSNGVIHEFGSISKDGDKFVFEGFRVEVFSGRLEEFLLESVIDDLQKQLDLCREDYLKRRMLDEMAPDSALGSILTNS